MQHRDTAAIWFRTVGKMIVHSRVRAFSRATVCLRDVPLLNRSGLEDFATPGPLGGGGFYAEKQREDDGRRNRHHRGQKPDAADVGPRDGLDLAHYLGPDETAQVAD